MKPELVGGSGKSPVAVITKNRQALGQLTAVLPDGSELVMSSLRQFSATRPLCP